MATSTFNPSIKRVSSPVEPVEVKGDLKKAKSLAKEKNFEQALAEVEAALGSNSSSLQAHLAAATLKIRLGRKDEALTHYQSLIRLAPTKTKAYLRAGKICLDQKKADQALRFFEGAIRVNPKLIVAYIAAAQAYLSQENYEQAIAKLVKAINLNPRSVVARQRLSLAYSKQLKYKEAIAQLQSALRVAPNDVNTYASLGRIYLLQADYASAQSAYQQAITLKPDSRVSARLGLAEALIKQDKLADANQLLLEIPQKDQSSARLHTLWGDLYKRQGLFKESVEEYKAAERLTTDVSELDSLEDIDFTHDKDDGFWEKLAVSLGAKAEAKVAAARSSK